MNCYQDHCRNMRLLLLSVISCLFINPVFAQYQPPVFPLGEGPWQFDTYERQTRIQVSVLTRGLSHPWSMAWLPDGNMLITERGGALRYFKDGTLQPKPLAGLSDLGIDRFMDIAVHPAFRDNRFIYVTYLKRRPHPDGSNKYWATTVLARGVFDGNSVKGVEEIFIADGWRDFFGGEASRLLFLPDGTLIMGSSHRRDLDGPQNLGNHVGKILRLRDDGSAAQDNPFIGREGARPEIYSYGHRTMLGFAVHPQTGELWQTENGPQGGDEVNIIRPGANYGWPLVTFGRDYNGTRVSESVWKEGIAMPELIWVPSVTTSGMIFYTGDRIPAWQGNLLLGSMMEGRLPGTGHLERIVFADNGGELRREALLTDLQQRIRDVRQGPDGRIYLLTEEAEAALLVIDQVGE